MFIEVKGHLINIEELIWVKTTEIIDEIQCEFLFKNNKMLYAYLKKEEYEKLKQTLLEDE